MRSCQSSEQPASPLQSLQISVLDVSVVSASDEGGPRMIYTSYRHALRVSTFMCELRSRGVHVFKNWHPGLASRPILLRPDQGPHG